ncbi:MAG: hypothetical protein V4760_19850 [Bdellovibrionota bacterium]
MKVGWLRDQVGSSNKYDLAVHGSSITQFGVNADLLGKKLSVRGMNFGVGGEVNLYYSYRAVRCSVSRFGVRQVVLQISSTTFNDNLNVSTQPQIPPPDAPLDPETECAWLGDDPNRFKISDNFIDIQKSSGIFKYSDNVERYFTEVKTGTYTPPYLRQISFKDRQLIEYKSLSLAPDGQVIGKTKMRTSVVDHDQVRWNPISSGQHLQNIAEFTKRNGVKLAIIQVPEFVTMRAAQPERYAEFERVICKFAELFSVPVINMNTLEAFPIDDPRLFVDSGHLNAEGSNVLSEKLAERLMRGDNSCRTDLQVPVYSSVVRNLQLELKPSNLRPERRVLVDAFHVEGKFGEFDRVDLVDGNGLSDRYFTNGTPIPKSDFNLGSKVVENSRPMREVIFKPGSQLIFPMQLHVPTTWGNQIRLKFRVLGLSEGPMTLAVSDVTSRKSKEIQIESENVDVDLSEFF